MHRFKQRHWVIPVAVLTLLTALAISSPANASPEELRPEDGFDTSVDETPEKVGIFPESLDRVHLPLSNDSLEAISSIHPGKAEVSDTILATGLDEKSAQTRSALQMQAYALRPSLRDQDPGYNTFRINDSSDGFVYTTTNSKAAKRLLSGVNNVEILSAAVSERELEEILEVAIDALGAPRMDGPVVLMDADKKSSQVVITVRKGSLDTVIEWADKSASASLLRGERVRFVETDEAIGEHATFRGGINATSCTWGFTVNHTGGNKRLTTAGHCGPTQKYAGSNRPYVSGSEVNSGNIDMQLHSLSSNPTALNEIYKGGSPTYRTILWTRNWSANDVDDVTCHRGKTSGYTCGKITHTTGSQTVGGGTRVLRTEGDNFQACGGDSGGPYVYGSTALGTHEGGSNPCGNWSKWTTIQYSEEYYPISVITS